MTFVYSVVGITRKNVTLCLTLVNHLPDSHLCSFKEIFSEYPENVTFVWIETRKKNIRKKSKKESDENSQDPYRPRSFDSVVQRLRDRTRRTAGWS